MDVIYDAMTEYLQAMILTDGFDVNTFTEFDRLFCLMVFFQISFFKDPSQFKCPHCGVDIMYRYDMSRYLTKMEQAYVENQEVHIPYKEKTYSFVIGWPTSRTMSQLYHYFYNELGNVTEEMERTQFGINFVMAFVRKISVEDNILQRVKAEIDLDCLDTFAERIECLNEIPSMVMFDEDEGLFNKITGYFINRLENCFSFEICPQCHKETDFGLPQSSVFYSLFYGSLRSLYGYIL